MKISKATNSEVKMLRRNTKYADVFREIDKADAGEYIKISQLKNGKECVTLARNARNLYYKNGIKLRIRIDAKKNTIYIAKKINETKNN